MPRTPRSSPKSRRSVASEIAVSYPESNPFKWESPPWNLSPRSRDHECAEDTPAFIAAALEQAGRNGINPLWSWYGHNPLLVYEERILYGDFPLDSYQGSPPPLPRAELQHPIEFLEQLNPHGVSYIYKVRVGQDIRLLKVFPDRDPDEETDPENIGRGMMRFRKEIEAYAHLLHYGVDKTGVVPHCYGWLDLSEEDLDNIATLPKTESELQPLQGTRRTPKGVLIEYFERIRPLSIHTVNPKLADIALRALYSIHAAYVKQGDVSRRNILLLHHDRVVWIDFDHSVCASERNKNLRPDRKALLLELAEAWGLFYTTLLPDKRIGFYSWHD